MKIKPTQPVQSNMADIMKQQMIAQLSKPKYCKLCGRPVLACGSRENGGANTAIEFEMQYEVHWDCYEKYQRRQQNGGT